MSTSQHAPFSVELERRLVEAFDDLWSGLVDRQEPYGDDADGTAWLALGAGVGPHDGSQSRATVGFADERQLAAIRNECRALALANEFAVNGHENRVSYIVGSGHTYRAAGKKHCETPPELIADVQTLLDEFVRVNRWHRRQQEIVLRVDRDGEAFLRYFVGSGGMTFIRFVEPGQIYAPPEAVRDPSLSYGIATDQDDVETVHAYYVDGLPIDADEIQHRKGNVDANVKRGLPLFYPVRKNLRRAEKLLRNMSTVAEIQSAIALIRKHRSATRTAVQQYVAAQPDSVSTGGAGASGTRSSTMRRFAPGTILDTYGNVDYDFPASALDASSYVAILQAELRAIAARLVMPEFMLSSDASNANYASTFIAESPALRMFERLQHEQIGDDREVMRRVVRNGIAAGRLPPEAATLVEIQIEPPSLAMRDAKNEADVRAVEYEHGILSPQTWCLLSGLDYDQEQTNLRDHARRKLDRSQTE